MRLALIGNLGLLTLAVVGLIPALPVHAGVIDSYTTSNDDAGNAWFGQSFTTPSGGPFDDITFNFFLGGNAFASGTAYLFSAAYTGSPDGLSTASDLATSTGVADNEYVFSDSVTLQADTTYYVFEDTQVDHLDIELNDGPDGSYNSGEAGLAFHSEGSDATLDYSVGGSVVSSTPEPGTVSLAALSGALLLLARKRQRADLSK
jgi:hypothetical protein